jgi:hypothetical protein
MDPHPVRIPTPQPHSATALHQIHDHRDPYPSAMLDPSPDQTHTLPGYTPLESPPLMPSWALAMCVMTESQPLGLPSKGKITTNTTEIQEIIRDYFESLYSNKFKNLEETDRFLETYDHPKLSQEDINCLNRSVTQKEIKQLSRASEKRKVQDLMDSLLNSIRHLEEIIPTLLKLFHEIEREGTLPNSFIETNITLIPKPDKDTSKNETYRPISLMNIDAKILNKKWQTKSKNTSE